MTNGATRVAPRLPRGEEEREFLAGGRTCRVVLRDLSGGWSWAIYGRDERGELRCLRQQPGFGDSRKNSAKQIATAAARSFAADSRTSS